MAVTPDYLRAVGEVIAAATSIREAAATWRTRDPAMRVVVVDAMEMRDETPVLSLEHCQVFLATSSGHCWTITQEAAQATALVLTEK